jgi:hypothetical protein
MLDLSVMVRQLTQGQAPAELTVLHAAPHAGGAAPEAPAQDAPARAAPAAGATPGGVDPRLVADRVYELMRQDVLVQNERRAR